MFKDANETTDDYFDPTDHADDMHPKFYQTVGCLVCQDEDLAERLNSGENLITLKVMRTSTGRFEIVEDE
ncbi:hypothetical protein AX761_21695 [Rhizobium sp. 58]|nr:hypothetical protein AX761_21695 [Rhizobium sp. 58]